MDLSHELAVAELYRFPLSSGRPSGTDGEQLRVDTASTWPSFATGRSRRSCQFELDDEEAAFAYAEERVRATTSRLAVTNRASTDSGRLGESDCRPRRRRAPSRCYADQFVYDDRRRLSGDPISDQRGMRAAMSASTWSSTTTSNRARWRCEVSACIWSEPLVE